VLVLVTLTDSVEPVFALVFSVVPELLSSPFNHSIMKRAREKGLLEVNLVNLRDHTTYARAQVDDYQFGGGAGMLMMCEPLAKAIEELSKDRTYDEIIFLTPDGELFNQKMANSLSLKENLLLICGHYKGIDQRVIDTFVTKEISIGDYVLTGGETAAIVLIDSITRLLPGVLGDSESALTDSFQTDSGFDAPQYTRPSEFRGMKVPEILLSGNHRKVSDWKMETGKAKFKKVKKKK